MRGILTKVLIVPIKGTNHIVEFAYITMIRFYILDEQQQKTREKCMQISLIKYSVIENCLELRSIMPSVVG